MPRTPSPASSCCTVSGRDSSDWDVWAFRVKPRLRSGMPCLGLEFSMAQTGRFLLVTAICTRAFDLSGWDAPPSEPIGPIFCDQRAGADKPLWPTPLEQERRATPLVRKARLKLAQRSRPSHPMSPPPDADRRRTAPSYYILTNLGQRDEPLTLRIACRNGIPFALRDFRH